MENDKVPFLGKLLEKKLNHNYFTMVPNQNFAQIWNKEHTQADPYGPHHAGLPASTQSTDRPGALGPGAGSRSTDGLTSWTLVTGSGSTPKEEEIISLYHS